MTEPPAAPESYTPHGPAQEGAAARALAVLEAPEHGLITSDFLRTEVPPKALYCRRAAEAPRRNGTS
jgi:hypothetical protein